MGTSFWIQDPDWVLVLDADERLQLADPQTLRDSLATDTALAYWLEIHNTLGRGRVGSLRLRPRKVPP